MGMRVQAYLQHSINVLTVRMAEFLFILMTMEPCSTQQYLYAT